MYYDHIQKVRLVAIPIHQETKEVKVQVQVVSRLFMNEFIERLLYEGYTVQVEKGD